MPKKPVDYTNTHFYKIVCKDLTISHCYVGHTSNFKRRQHEHKRTYYDEKDHVHYNIYLYDFIRKNGGWDNFEMILVKTQECEGSLHARQIERQYIEELNATLNKIRLPLSQKKNIYNIIVIFTREIKMK